jgi:hypothetical protein
MRALMTGISTWIIPAIAAAAKLIHGQTHKALGTDFPQIRSDEEDNAKPKDGRCKQLVERTKAKLEAMKWPD